MRRGPRDSGGLLVTQVRSGALSVALCLVVFTHVTVSSFLSTGGAALIKQLSPLLHNPAISAFYGHPYRIYSPGGFAVWKSGAFMATVAAVWVALACTRVTRGAEDNGTFDLLSMGRRDVRAMTDQVALVLLGCSVLAGGAVTGGFLWSSLSLSSSVLYGLGIACVTACFAASALVLSQLLAPRRAASSVAVMLVALGYVVRMLADGTNSFSALRWATPFGWLEELRAFDQNHWWVLAPLVVAPVLLWILARALCTQRDVGAGFYQSADRASAHRTLLAGPWRFAWRQRLTLVTAWSAASIVMAGLIGGLLHSIVNFARQNPAYVHLLTRYGFGEMVSAKGFVAEMDLLAAVAFSFLALSSLHVDWSDELEGRLATPLAVGRSRVSWLWGSLLATVATVATAATFSALALAVGSWAGGASLSLISVLEGSWNAAVVVAPVVGVVLLLHGLVPRLTVGVTSALLAASFIDNSFGVVLHWPRAVIDLSLFHYVAHVPAVPVDWKVAGILFAVGVVCGAAGFDAFARRNLFV